MSATLLDGKALAEEIKGEVAAAAARLAKSGRKADLAAIQVGENPASRIYTNMQAKSCEEVGIAYRLVTLPAETSQADLLAKLDEVNRDASVSGVILQMPVPPGIDARLAQMSIAPAKDVEGVHPANMGRLFFGSGHVAPCTPLAAVEILRRHWPDLAGKEVVIVGHSEIVGKPIAAMLLQSVDAAPTVTVCHVATRDLSAHTRRAEVLIVATGVSQARWLGYRRRKAAGENPPLPDLGPLVKGDMIADGAVVIDVAINRIPKGFDAAGEPLKNDKGKTAMVTVGDVDFEAAKAKASAITPVPGGVGPVTVAMLLRNTIACAKATA